MTATQQKYTKRLRPLFLSLQLAKTAPLSGDDLQNEWVGVACLVTYSRKEVLIDAADLGHLPDWTWTVWGRCVGEHWYYRITHKVRGVGRYHLHRHLLGYPNGSVDHINGNTLDNRRANLRACTHAENMRNRRLGTRTSTGFKGVSRSGNRYRAVITVDRKNQHLGYFATAEEAHAAYCAAAPRVHGEFARLK